MRVASILTGGRFDVARARAHALALLVKGRLASPPDVRAACLDWMEFRSRPVHECPIPASGHGLQFDRLGKRLLAALEGQPSECPRCQPPADQPGYFSYQAVYRADADGSLTPTGEYRQEQCRACNGTGHNLRGVLPPVAETPAQRWRREDSERREDERAAERLRVDAAFSAAARSALDRAAEAFGRGECGVLATAFSASAMGESAAALATAHFRFRASVAQLGADPDAAESLARERAASSVWDVASFRRDILHRLAQGLPP